MADHELALKETETERAEPEHQANIPLFSFYKQTSPKCSLLTERFFLFLNIAYGVLIPLFYANKYPFSRHQTPLLYIKKVTVLEKLLNLLSVFDFVPTYLERPPPTFAYLEISQNNPQEAILIA